MTLKNLFVSVVIVNYNGLSFIENCLKTVLSSDYPSFEIILVDNHSKDGSLELVRELFGNYNQLNVISNQENLGFAMGNNIGLTHAKGDIIVFLNNDTEVDHNWLRRLADCFITNSDVGMAQCMLIQLNDRSSIQSAGVLWNPILGWQVPRPRVWTRADEYPDIAVACAGAMAIRRSLIDQIGGLDSDYFINYEDVDLSFRAWLQGYRVVLVPDSYVYHASPAMHSPVYTRTQSFMREFHSSKNVVSTIIKNYELRNIMKYLPTTLAFFLFRAIFLTSKYKNIKMFVAVLKGILWNLHAPNLIRTIKKRMEIQKEIRKVRDKYIETQVWLKTTNIE